MYYIEVFVRSGICVILWILGLCYKVKYNQVLVVVAVEKVFGSKWLISVLCDLYVEHNIVHVVLSLSDFHCFDRNEVINFGSA